MNHQNIADLLISVRQKRPLVHHITNYVTVNDCANITLCAGASPVMAQAPEEVEEIVALSGALVLNIGTLSPDLVESMLIAGKAANSHDIPIILDPVGAGATALRTKSARYLLDTLSISVLKGNAGEIGVIAGTGGEVRGVDSAGLTGDPVLVAQACADMTGVIVAMSGPTDIVTDGTKVALVKNGHELMGKVSGTGCMAASLIGAFTAVSHEYMDAAAAALATFGRAGELAGSKATAPYSFRTALFDSLYALTPEDIARNAHIETL